MAKFSEIYLGKSGKVHGPFTSEEFDELQASGKISQYTYLWDFRSAQWKPIELPPPPLALAQAEGRQERVLKQTPSGIEAVCFDRHHLIGATLRHVTESGCELVCQETAAAPQFPQRSVVTINLVDDQTGASVNVPARLIQAYRDSGRWTYRVRWDSCPELLSKTA